MLSSVKLASRLAVAGSAAVVAGACVAGCGSSASSSAAAPATSAASSAPATPASSAPVASATPTAAASTLAPNVASGSPSATSSGGSAAGPGCGSMDLSAHVGVAQGTAGSIYQVIYLTNLGNSPCTLYGYPGVALAGGSSTADQVGAAATRSSTTAPAVVALDPGKSANATLRVVEAGNYPTATCKPTATTFLQIFPPGQTTPIYLAYKSTGCASSSVKLLSVTAMAPGTGG